MVKGELLFKLPSEIDAINIIAVYRCKVDLGTSPNIYPSKIVKLAAKCILHKAIRARMFSYTKVSSEEALLLINDVVRQVQQHNKQVAVAVSGPEGELIAFVRMDGASPAASRIARNKAYTAAIDRKDTRLMDEFMQEKRRPPAYWGDDGITGFGGGVTIKIAERVIGGIGVSGLSEDEDAAIAKAAIQAIYKAKS